MSYQARLNNAIPGGAHTYSRGVDQFPSNAPQILDRGDGAYVWDLDGNKYLDYGMALRAVTLGYANTRVNEAVFREIQKGNNLTRPSLVELDAAELMINLIPAADMVKFAKNGSNVTSAAVKLARAYTGKRYVCIPRGHPFFSFDDWFIGTTPVKRGIPEEHSGLTLLFDYGDADSLEKLFLAYPGQIAAVLLEPATTETPCGSSCNSPLTSHSVCSMCPNVGENFLHIVRQMCDKFSALFILDEMITGFRWHLQGAQTYFGVTPDISTFGKGMANGFSVAALVGRREVMEIAAIDTIGLERTFLLSTTHGGEMSSLGAFIETVKIYKDYDVCTYLWEYGAKLRSGLREIVSELGLQERFLIIGEAVNMNYLTLDASGHASLAFRTLFNQEMISRGVMMPWIAPSFSHGESELNITLDAVRHALSVYLDALNDDCGVERFLNGPSIQPVFRKYN